MKLDWLIEKALQEDIGSGDITSEYLFSHDNQKTDAFLIVKEDGLLAGLNVAEAVFRKMDPEIKWIPYRKDGDFLNKGDAIVKITGSAKAILGAERVALNFLQRLCGIATRTREMADIIAPYKAKLLDTRKTTPLLRELEKYAVRVGGGYNHRFGLFDLIMIKENHIHAAGSITKAVEHIRLYNVNYKIEVEVKNLKELREAYKCQVDRVMLDNMPLNSIRKAVSRYGDKIDLEVSGGVNANNIEKYAKTGVHFISVGFITHSVKSLDISLLFREL